MIFLDFDGTLIDLWPRYYAVFTRLTGLQNVTLDAYRTVKRQLIRDAAVADYFHRKLPDEYFEKKALLLESREYLKLDNPFLRIESLNELFQNGAFLLLSKRRNEQNLIWELDRLNIRVPVRVLSGESKREWIGKHDPSVRSVIIGDSIQDLEAGELVNVSPVMVSYGLQTAEQFDSLHIPYQLLETPEELYIYLKEALEWNFET